MNKIAKTALMTGTALCVAGVVLSTAGYFAGGKDFTYASDHVYVSGGNSSVHKNLAVMKKEQPAITNSDKAIFRFRRLAAEASRMVGHDAMACSPSQTQIGRASCRERV